MSLVWLDLNSSYSHSSLALPAIEAQKDVKDNTMEWVRVSATLNSDMSQVVEEIVSHNPQIVAATAWLFTHTRLHDIMRRVKSLMPNIVVIYGGPEFLGNNRDYLYINSYVDVLFRGEGELEFHKWLKVYNDKSSWHTIKGLCYRDDYGKYIDNGNAKANDYASLRYPEESQFFNWDKAFVQLETTRGCFNSCAFCVSSGDKPIRNIPVSEIKKRLEKIESHGIKDVRLLDRTFNGNQQRTIELLDLFTEYSGKLKFHLEIHPSLLTKEIRNSLKSIPKGVLHLEAGIQSLDNKVLEISSRRGDAEKALEGLSFLSSQTSFETHADLIVGLPLYSLEQVYSDVITLTNIDVAEIQLETLKLLPGTLMRSNASSLKIKYSPLPPYEVLETPHITYSEISQAMTLSKILDIYFNNPLYRTVTKKLINTENKFLSNFTIEIHQTGILNSPLSAASRGEILYDYCKNHHNEYLTDISEAWITAGFSMKKEIAGGIASFSGTLPEKMEIQRGEPNMATRFYKIESNTKNIYFGFNRKEEHSSPVFIGYEIL